MRKNTIIYDPQLMLEEIASRNGCSVNTVRQYIQYIDTQEKNS